MKNEIIIKRAAFGMTVGAMVAGATVFAIALFSGRIDFSSWQLPVNMFDSPATAAAILGVITLIVSVPVYIRLFLRDAIKGADATADDVKDNAGNNFARQLAALVITPIVLFTAFYYIAWVLIAVVAFTLPYVILAILAIGAGLIIWLGLTQMKLVKTALYVLAALIITAVYSIVWWYFCFFTL